MNDYFDYVLKLRINQLEKELVKNKEENYQQIVSLTNNAIALLQAQATKN